MRSFKDGLILLSVIFLSLFLTQASLAATISVDIDQTVGPVNTLLFGNAQPFGHGDAFLENESNAMDPEAVSLVSALGPTILRFPGHADEYFWEDGIGPQDQRPSPRPGQYQGFGFRYGTDEHLALCRALGAEAFFTVNYGSGLVDGVFTLLAPLSQRAARAADWVEYCNAPNDGRNPNGGIDWAARRAQNGYPEPYAVKFWEIGNEIYGQDVIGHVDVLTYAQELRVFSQAMKSVDPSIRIGAVGVLPPHGIIPWDNNGLEWNATLLDIAQEDIDFLVVHAHYPGSWNLPTDVEDLYKASLAGSEQAWLDFKEIRQIIDQRAHHPIGIVPGENGLFLGLGENYQLITSLLAGLQYADLLMLFAQQSASLNIIFSCGWTLHSWGLCGDIAYQFWPEQRWLRPEAQAQQFFHDHCGQILVSHSVDCGTFSTVKAAMVQTMTAVPELSVYSSVDSTHTELHLMVLNRQLHQDVSAAIQLTGFEPHSEGHVWTLNGPGLAADNESDHEAVAIISSTLDDLSSCFIYTFPAHSLTAIELTRAQSEEQPPVPPSIVEASVTDLAGHSAVVVWQTDQPTDSKIEYGARRSYNSVLEDSAQATHHRFILEPLDSQSRYYFRASGRDAWGQVAPAWEDSFWTPDVTAPELSAVEVVAVTETTATLQWTTTEPSDTRLEYQADGDPRLFFQERDLREIHEVSLDGLEAARPYLFWASGADSVENLSLPVEGTFTTSSPRSGAGQPGDAQSLPEDDQLWQNYPNPFNASTRICYRLCQGQDVSLRIYNPRGQLVRILVEEYQPAGDYQLCWDARDAAGQDVASGMYLCSLATGQFQKTCKMALVR